MGNCLRKFPCCPLGSQGSASNTVSPGESLHMEGLRKPRPDNPRREYSEVSTDIREPDPKESDVLRVEKVNLNVVTNTKAHHTNEFDITETAENPKLVLRRGQAFTIQLDFNREFKEQEDDLRIIFEIGEHPIASKGTHVEFVLSDKDEPNHWGAKIEKHSGKSLWMTLFTPSTTIVGKWQFKIDVVKQTDHQTSVFRYSYKDPIYILFNPWCKEDAVYLENDAYLQEYVLNETGRIYAGTSKVITAKPWSFGQFSGNILDCVMHLLEISGLNLSVRGNPIPVVRKLTALVNAQDEGGVLSGNWSGDYSGGTPPLTWTGSGPILEQYYKQKYSVKFGQCWVFAGVLCTVCRALGIPTRCVTNFASAHDSDTSITIDMHFGEDGKPLEDENVDSVWNFHVWNEVWMSRPDLKPGYGGWQAADATPQEASDGIYCCGPVSVQAIKEGEVNLPYDGPFVFAEVNADTVYWMCYKDGRIKNVYIEKNAIGKFISTKAINKDEREDITRLYKFPEDSPEERTAVLRANQTGSLRRDVYVEGPSDVKFRLLLDNEKTYIGNEAIVILSATNNSKEKRTVKGLLILSTMYYTGVVSDQVASEPYDGIELQPGETKEVKLACKYEKYHQKLKDCCMLSITASAHVAQTEQIFTKKDELRLRKPHITIKAPDTVKVGEEFSVEASFTNSLPTTLTNCQLDVDGPGLTEVKKYPHGDVQAKGTFILEFKLKPLKPGKRQIITIFNCNQVEDVNGTLEVNVRE